MLGRALATIGALYFCSQAQATDLITPGPIASVAFLSGHWTGAGVGLTGPTSAEMWSCPQGRWQVTTLNIGNGLVQLTALFGATGNELSMHVFDSMGAYFLHQVPTQNRNGIKFLWQQGGDWRQVEFTRLEYKKRIAWKSQTHVQGYSVQPRPIDLEFSFDPSRSCE